MANLQVSSDASLHEFVKALATAEAAQGATSASAVAVEMGTSLLLMVAALPQTRSGSAEDLTALASVATALSDIQEQLFEAIETESAIKVLAARNMPQASQAQRVEREAALQLALRTSADIPLEIMRLAALGLRHARTTAEHACRAASNEVELAVALLRVGFTGARANLESRLTSLTDVVYTKAVVEEIVRLADEAATSAHGTESFLKAPPA
jgi:formiminotetrahydrofolate cyclodeaminase